MSQSDINKKLLRLVFAGSVDDGKSTLIGRLLYETGSVYRDQLDAVKRISQDRGLSGLDFSLITDGLQAEREQGITIDVAYRYMETAEYKIIIADVPGHEQYTRNMITGASLADVVLILIDAQKGVQIQTRRHLLIASLLGIRQVALVVNKMDSVSFDRYVFESIVDQLQPVIEKLEFETVEFIPISAKLGDAVVSSRRRMEWYTGKTVLEYITSSVRLVDSMQSDFRFIVQLPLRTDVGRRYAGLITSGKVRNNQFVTIQPANTKARVSHLVYDKQGVEEASAFQAVTIGFDQELDIGRGDLVTGLHNQPVVTTEVEAMIFWMSSEPLVSGDTVLLQHTNHVTRAFVVAVLFQIDLDTFREKEAAELKCNDIGLVRIKTNEPIVADVYKVQHRTGCCIIINDTTKETVGAGIIQRTHFES